MYTKKQVTKMKEDRKNLIEHRDSVKDMNIEMNFLDEGISFKIPIDDKVTTLFRKDRLQIRLETETKAETKSSDLVDYNSLRYSDLAEIVQNNTPVYKEEDIAGLLDDLDELTGEYTPKTFVINDTIVFQTRLSPQGFYFNILTDGDYKLTPGEGLEIFVPYKSYIKITGKPIKPFGPTFRVSPEYPRHLRKLAINTIKQMITLDFNYIIDPNTDTFVFEGLPFSLHPKLAGFLKKNLSQAALL